MYPFLVPEKTIRSDIMLSIVKEWEKDRTHDLETSSIEYLVTDFVGPVVKFDLKRYGAGRVKAYPKDAHVENASFSMSDLNVLKEASKELVKEFGSCTLCIPLFEVEICSEEDVKKIEEKLLNIRLF